MHVELKIDRPKHSIETCYATLEVTQDDGRTAAKKLDFSGNAISPMVHAARAVVDAINELAGRP
jgi:hypothetical protein